MKIACLADTHLSSPELESDSLFPKQMHALRKMHASRLYDEIRSGIDRSFTLATRLLRSRSYPLLVHLGDLTGGYMEYGMAHPSTRALAITAKQTLTACTQKLRFCAGNLDLGYASGLGSDVSWRSIEAWRSDVDELFWFEEVNHLLMIGICSTLANYQGTDARIRRLADDQTTFVAATLTAYPAHDWLLFAHSPWLGRPLLRVIEHRMPDLQTFAFGDLHNPRFGNLLRAAARFTTPLTANTPGSTLKTQLRCLRKSVMVPSLAPLWWRGHAFLEMQLHAGSVDAEQRHLSIDQSWTHAPGAHFWECLWWMLRPRRRPARWT